MAAEKKYREEYAIAMLKRMIPYQTRAIRRKREWSQAQLAQASQLTQGVISRAEDPDYGNLTLTTIGRIAAGYDLAAIVKFVPFSELVRYSENTSEKAFANLPTFEEENAETGTAIDNSGVEMAAQSLLGATKAVSGAGGAMIATLNPTVLRTEKKVRTRVRRERESAKRGLSLKVKDEQQTERNRNNARESGSAGIDYTANWFISSPSAQSGIAAR